MRTITGLRRLKEDKFLQNKITGNIGLLCHAASLTDEYEFAPEIFKNIYGDRLVKLFGPQHGFVTDVQDNMVESKDYIHPYFKIPVYSLYGSVRWPTEEMLKGVDTLVIDLQDVGVRVYTYIWTISYILEQCEQKDIKVVILDRPNPLGGEILEGTILDKNFASFVGRDEILHRHGLTLGEFAKWYLKKNFLKTNLEVIEMHYWKRELLWHQTQLPWVNPSPNLPLAESAYVFPATVLLEGTNLSEGRGTTRSLEFIGHPKIEPYAFIEELEQQKDFKMATEGVKLRPTVAHPMFQKHAGKANGGFHIHITNHQSARTWRLGQFLLREFAYKLQNDFSWNQETYEYEIDNKAIDLINGDSIISKWVEDRGELSALIEMERKAIEIWKNETAHIKIY